MKQLSEPISHAHLIEQYVGRMRDRDQVVKVMGLRLDIAILRLELAVDLAFARAGFSAPCEVQRP